MTHEDETELHRRVTRLESQVAENAALIQALEEQTRVNSAAIEQLRFDVIPGKRRVRQ